MAVAAIDANEFPAARATFDALREAEYVTNRGKRGIELDNGRFGHLAEVLHDECNWEPDDIRVRLKHYNGWDDHDWA